MDRHHDMISLLCGDHIFFGIRREPGVPDDVVVGGVHPGVQQSWHRCHEAIVFRVSQGPSKRDGGIRFKEDRRHHSGTVLVADLRGGR